MISAIGSRSLGSNPICTASTRMIISVMDQAGVSQLITVSGKALGEQPGWVMTILVRLLLKHIFADAAAADDLIQ